MNSDNRKRWQYLRRLAAMDGERVRFERVLLKLLKTTPPEYTQLARDPQIPKVGGSASVLCLPGPLCA